jgi:hypothetical protein
MDVKNLRRTIVKKMLRNCLCGLGLALLVVSVASAESNFVNKGVAGVSGLHGHAVLPPAAIFTNCGTNCTSYDTGDGYYLAGSSATDGPGQTLAIGFSATKKTKFTYALTPNTNYVSIKGAISAYLLNGTATGGPTTELSKLSSKGTVPDYPTIKVVKYTSKKAVTFKAKTTYFLCETVATPTAVFLWMLSNSDTSSPFWFQDTDTCTKKGTTWDDATGDTAPATQIN